MNLPEPVSQAANWALVVGLAFFSADASSALIQRQLAVAPKPLPQAVVGVVQDNVPAQAPPPALVSLLKTTAPAVAPAAVVKGGVNTPPPANLPPANFTLRGTMAGVGGMGLAMIDLNGQTQVVSVGEEISGYTLTQVTSYSVQLEANGQVQVLEMDTTGQTTTFAPPPPVAAQPPPPQDVVPDPNATPTLQEPTAAAGAILTQRELRGILDNPQGFASQGFQMKPQLVNGEIIGMRVTMPDPSHPLARLGIQNGDVVRSLNSTPLVGPESLAAVYRELRNSSSLSFDVQRGGADQKVDITLEE